MPGKCIAKVKTTGEQCANKPLPGMKCCGRHKAQEPVKEAKTVAKPTKFCTAIVKTTGKKCTRKSKEGMRYCGLHEPKQSAKTPKRSAPKRVSAPKRRVSAPKRRVSAPKSPPQIIPPRQQTPFDEFAKAFPRRSVNDGDYPVLLMESRKLPSGRNWWVKTSFVKSIEDFERGRELLLSQFKGVTLTQGTMFAIGDGVSFLALMNKLDKKEVVAAELKWDLATPGSIPTLHTTKFPQAIDAMKHLSLTANCLGRVLSNKLTVKFIVARTGGANCAGSELDDQIVVAPVVNGEQRFRDNTKAKIVKVISDKISQLGKSNVVIVIAGKEEEVTPEQLLQRVKKFFGDTVTLSDVKQYLRGFLLDYESSPGETKIDDDLADYVKNNKLHIFHDFAKGQLNGQTAEYMLIQLMTRQPLPAE